MREPCEGCAILCRLELSSSAVGSRDQQAQPHSSCSPVAGSASRMLSSVTFASARNIRPSLTGSWSFRRPAASVAREGSAADPLPGEKGRHDRRELARSVDHRQMASALEDDELAVAYDPAKHLTGRRR
jgi:hypothetical protein